MNTWIQCLLNSAEAEKDFFAWVSKAEQNCFRLMQQALLNGDAVKATGLAYEAQAYQTFQRAYKTQVAVETKSMQYKEE